MFPSVFNSEEKEAREEEENFISALGISSRISNGSQKGGILLALICEHSSNNSSCDEDYLGQESNSEAEEKSSHNLIDLRHLVKKQSKNYFSKARYEKNLKRGLQRQDSDPTYSEEKRLDLFFKGIKKKMLLLTYLISKPFSEVTKKP
jgi:hypothetical protein